MGVYSYALKGLKAGATKLAQKLSGQGKTTGTGAINTTKPGTKLTFKRGEQDKFVKFRDNLYKSAKFDTATKNKLKSKQPLTKINKGKSDIFTPKEPKFSKGGRVGLKRGSFPDHSGDGKITKKDILMARGVIPKPKKSKSPMDKQVRQKAAFGGGADMGKVASDKTKAEVKKYEKRAKDASKFLKNKGRSLGSMMREKYMR